FALKNRASSPSENASERWSLSLAEASNFRIPEGFGRFLSLQRATFRWQLATCCFLSPSELDRTGYSVLDF
ncbi:hypothetical protein A2U01_0066924, partial [Trifolium medium]|nr:hypothetical protein [Trifolium medium]